MQELALLDVGLILQWDRTFPSFSTVAKEQGLYPTKQGFQMQKKQPRSDCPINFALEIFGDKWTLLIVRDIVYAGKKTHGEFLKSDERIATNILADRLARLECQGILTKAADPKDKRREIFSLTEEGLALIPLLLDIQSWSNAFGPAYIGRSATLEAALKKDREKVIADITDSVRHGGFLFANEEWFPPRKAQ